MCLIWEVLFNMDLCSPEEDDYGNMFIMQESRNVVPLVPNFDAESEMCEGSEILEISKQDAAHYSDISDVEDFDMESSQTIKTPM